MPEYTLIALYHYRVYLFPSFLIEVLSLPQGFGSPFRMLWVLSLCLALHFTLRLTVKQKGPFRLSRICFELVPWISVGSGISTYRYWNLLTITVIIPVFRWRRLRHYTGVNAGPLLAGLRLVKFSFWV